MNRIYLLAVTILLVFVGASKADVLDDLRKEVQSLKRFDEADVTTQRVATLNFTVADRCRGFYVAEVTAVPLSDGIDLSAFTSKIDELFVRRGIDGACRSVYRAFGRNGSERRKFSFLGAKEPFGLIQNPADACAAHRGKTFCEEAKSIGASVGSANWSGKATINQSAMNSSNQDWAGRQGVTAPTIVLKYSELEDTITESALKLGLSIDPKRDGRCELSASILQCNWIIEPGIHIKAVHQGETVLQFFADMDRNVLRDRATDRLNLFVNACAIVLKSTFPHFEDRKVLRMAKDFVTDRSGKKSISIEKMKFSVRTYPSGAGAYRDCLIMPEE